MLTPRDTHLSLCPSPSHTARSRQTSQPWGGAVPLASAAPSSPHPGQKRPLGPRQATLSPPLPSLTVSSFSSHSFRDRVSSVYPETTSHPLSPQAGVQCSEHRPPHRPPPGPVNSSTAEERAASTSSVPPGDNQQGASCQPCCPGPFLNHSRGHFFQLSKPWSPLPGLGADWLKTRHQRRTSAAHLWASPSRCSSSRGMAVAHR